MTGVDILMMVSVLLENTVQRDILEPLKPRLQLRFDYDPTATYRARLRPVDAIRREPKKNI